MKKLSKLKLESLNQSQFYSIKKKISIDFPVDYEASDNSFIKRKEFDTYASFIEKSYPDLKIKKVNFIIKAQTNVEPWIHCALFYTPQYHNRHDTIFLSEHNKIVLYFKKDNENKRTYFLVFNLARQYKNNDLFNLLKQEASDIFSNLKIGKSYKKSSPESPFQIAHSAFTRDSTTDISPIKALETVKNNYKTEQEKNIWLQTALKYNSFIMNNSRSARYLSEFKTHGLNAVPVLNYLMVSGTASLIRLPEGEFTLIKRIRKGFIIEQNDLIIN